MQHKGKLNIGIIGGVAIMLALTLAVATAAYRTHHNEDDSEIFFKAYPQTSGTRLDGCDVCHSRVMAPPIGQQGGQTVSRNACDSCHLLTDYGRKKADVLTPFGRDYMKNGRNAAAFSVIAKLDSDGDGATNADELAAMTDPGDPQSAPNKMEAAHVIISYDDLLKKQIPVREQAMFANVTKSRDGDSYSDLSGFRLIEVLEAAGIAKDAKSIDVISADGYVITFSIEQLRKSWPQSAPVFGLGTETLGECGWVRYGAKNLREGTPLPPADILLAFAENGENYQPASISADGRINGNGPLRVVAPQMMSPGIPDISINATQACIQKVDEKYRYHRDYEKNADYCVKAVVAIRVNPMPEDVMDINWQKYTKQAIAEKSVVIFGALNR